MFPLILSLLVSLIDVNCATIDPVVSTRYGPIQGLNGFYNLTNFQYNYQAFLGIPFAEPPLGNKRFQLPEYFNSTWLKPYQATYFRDGCAQKPSKDLNFNISENCLYLNLWRPEFDDKESQLLPVFYHIHGSGYTSSSGSMPDCRGEILAATQKIIVVNSNYRLGAFGFAFGEHDEMPGNLGIYDTLMVLKWIHDNIRSFGGDPDRVTLTGLSAGSKMVSIISSLANTRQLYSRLIMMSGSATNQIHMDSHETGTMKTKFLARKVNCLSVGDELKSSIKLSMETIDCLKKVSTDDLVQAQSSKEINGIGASEITAFLPVYGTKLIPNPPMVNHANHLEDNQNVPMLFGSEQDEASMFITEASLATLSTIQDAYEFTKDRVSFAIKNLTTDQFEAIFKLYFDEADPTDYLDIRSRCVKFCSDMNYKCPSLILSEFLSQVNDDIFFYRNVYTGENLSRPYGTKHGDDLLFGLGAPYRHYDNYSPSDRQFSSIMLEIFGNFTKGIPLNDWTSIKLDKNDPNALQLIKQFSLNPRNVIEHSQYFCSEWAELYNYSIP